MSDGFDLIRVRGTSDAKRLTVASRNFNAAPSWKVEASPLRRYSKTFIVGGRADHGHGATMICLNEVSGKTSAADDVIECLDRPIGGHGREVVPMRGLLLRQGGKR